MQRLWLSAGGALVSGGLSPRPPAFALALAFRVNFASTRTRPDGFPAHAVVDLTSPTLHFCDLDGLEEKHERHVRNTNGVDRYKPDSSWASTDSCLQGSGHPRVQQTSLDLSVDLTAARQPQGD